MAYDLFFRKQIPNSFSRGEGAAAAGIAGGLCVIAAAGALLIPKLARRTEIKRYRSEYAGNLHATQEMPIIPMAELMRQPREYGR